MYTHIISNEDCTDGSSQWNKLNKGHKDWEGRYKFSYLLMAWLFQYEISKNLQKAIGTIKFI